MLCKLLLFLDQISGGEGAEVSGGTPWQGFIQDFLFGGEVDPKKLLDPRSGDKKIFRTSRGSGVCSPGKF